MTGFDEREQAAYDRTVELFGTAAPDVRVADGTWSVRDVLAHLVTVARRYTAMPRLAETPREVDAINAEELDALGDAGVDELLAEYAQAFARYREFWVPMPVEHRWPFHGGGQLGTTHLRTNWLGEMLVHGYDAAAATGVDWTIGGDDARDLLVFMREVLPSYGRAGCLPVSVGLHLDGCEPWTLVAGSEGVRAAVPGDAEATLRGPAGVAVLMLYQRLGPAEAVDRGLRIDGDASALARLRECVEPP